VFSSLLVSDHLFEQFIVGKNNAKKDEDYQAITQFIDSINLDIYHGISVEQLRTKYGTLYGQWDSRKQNKWDGGFPFGLSVAFYAMIPLDTTFWEIRKVGSYYLMVPQHLLKNLGCIPSKTMVRSSDLTACEIKLGLRVDHLPRITQKDLNTMTRYAGQDTWAKEVPTCFKDIFVTKRDYLQAHADEVIWNISLLGHGLHASKEKVYRIKRLNPFLIPVKLIKKLENIFKKRHNQQPLLSQTAEQQKDLLIPSFAEHHYDDGYVASMKTATAKELLKFADKHLKTNFFFIDTCFGGGYNFEQLLCADSGSTYYPYTYPIILATNFDAVTLGSIAQLPQPGYIDESNIDRQLGRLTFTISNEAFGHLLPLIKSAMLEDLIKGFQPYVDAWENVHGNNVYPALKYPNIDRIMILKSRKYHLTIGDVMAATHMDRAIVVCKDIKSVSFATEFIERISIASRQSDLRLASGIPGSCQHTIKYLDAREHTFFDVKSMFRFIEYSAARKEFKVQELITKEGTYYNVAFICEPKYQRINHPDYPSEVVEGSYWIHNYERGPRT
jgi:hypothetical protein